MRSLIAVVFGLATISPAWAASTDCPKNFFDGQAPNLINSKLATKTQPLCFTEFAVLHSGLTRTPLYSADHLTAQRVALAKQMRRADAQDTFHEEQSLRSGERAWLKDYVRSGYDRGHMSPNGDMDNPVAQGESFSLANMVPQWPSQNRGIWESIEEATRAMASRYGEVWVVTIPLFAGAQTQWLHDRVAIPAKIAKAIYIPSTNVASAYISDNGPDSGWQSISVAQLRDMSGIDPFPAVAESVKAVAVQLPTPPARRSFSKGGH